MYGIRSNTKYPATATTTTTTTMSAPCTWHTDRGTCA
jgi:hypothetical protein